MLFGKKSSTNNGEVNERTCRVVLLYRVLSTPCFPVMLCFGFHRGFRVSLFYPWVHAKSESLFVLLL